MAATARERGGRFLYGRASSWLRRKRREEKKGLMSFYYYSDSLLREREIENAVCSYIFFFMGRVRVRRGYMLRLCRRRDSTLLICAVLGPSPLICPCLVSMLRHLWGFHFKRLFTHSLFLCVVIIGYNYPQVHTFIRVFALPCYNSGGSIGVRLLHCTSILKYFFLI